MTEIRRLIAARGVEAPGCASPARSTRASSTAPTSAPTCFCLPCRILADGDRDGIPNVLVEAMACGLPVVTTPVSGIPELVRDGDNGLLVPPDDPRRVRRGAAATARRSRTRRPPRRAPARETVLRRFDGDQLARRLAALFEEAIA